MSTSFEDHERYKEATTVRKIVLIVFTILLVVLIAVGVSGYLYVKSALEPVDPDDETVKEITIPLGSSVANIAQILEENGIIKNDKIFRYYVKFKNEADFQAGEYQLTSAMTLDEIIEALKTGKVLEEAVLTVTVPEGKTVEEIATIFANHTSITEEEFIEKANDREFVESLIQMYPTVLSEEILHPDIKVPLEGYLFAATYDFYTEEPTVESIILTMLDKTEDVVMNYYDAIQNFEQMDLTVHEALTMASLIEKEAPHAEDRKLIAGVFYNRLEAGMLLQTDPTVLYAMGEHKEDILKKDLEIDSPYNTYIYAGIPIGPISNFSENSLQAAIEPDIRSYYYFLADSEGVVHYSETNEEHNQKRAQYGLID